MTVTDEEVATGAREDLPHLWSAQEVMVASVVENSETVVVEAAATETKVAMDKVLNCIFEI